MEKSKAIEAVVFGIVQGVGFRPFIYRTARNLKYSGWVKNIGFGVEIHLESETPCDFSDFIKALNHNKPPLARIEKIDIRSAEWFDCREFYIKKTGKGRSFVFISPDISICDNCHKEMNTSTDRRFLYPFINCTDCGPRYTIVNSLPYDREKTTMVGFKMCGNCHKEYSDPMDRRYHAQPIACPDCGPQVTLLNTRTGKHISRGIKKATELLKSGNILAVKGLGGFHLACDPFNKEAVQKLRKIKARNYKPLALMAKDIKTVMDYAHVSPAEKEQLCSPRRPIVLLKKKNDIQGIAPGLNELGFMLPYTPLHHLLLEDIELFVATSSNLKDSPIMKDENEGVGKLCDYILTHDRPISMRADDSVMKIFNSRPLFFRRARGYVPYPQAVPEQLKYSGQILALGGELKDTISVYKNGYVITSQFLGDLDEYQNFKYFQEAIAHLSRLFDIKPDIIVSDLHPDFHTTRYAEKSGMPHLQVQHHFAHILAPMLEHNIARKEKVLGIALDGFGYGSDGTAWGGEFLLTDYSGYKRFAHFEYIPLPGGDLAAKQPWRMSLAYLYNIFGRDLPALDAFVKVSPDKIKGVIGMIEQKLCCPQSSSCGRLFDAVSFLAGLAPSEVEFEAQAPMLLESCADSRINHGYEFELSRSSEKDSFKGPYIVSFRKTIKAIVRDIENKTSISEVSAKFHNTLADIIVAVSLKCRQEHNINTVVLVGGVFLNKYLLQAAFRQLEKQDFHILRPVLYSPNDESISLGQIAFALEQKA